MRSPPMSIGECAASTTQTCVHWTAIRDSQLTDLYVEDGVVRGFTSATPPLRNPPRRK